MDNLRHQYLSGAATPSKPRVPNVQRRPPMPSQRSPPNNYGGPSEYGTSIVSSQYTSPTPTLPYHDLPGSRNGPFGAAQRGNVSSSSGTTTPSDTFSASRAGNPPWRSLDERPRSPPYERTSPKLGVFRLEPEPREPRPAYVAPPMLPDNVVRGEHAGSFGQAAQNLSPGLGISTKASKEMLGKNVPPTLRSPLEKPELTMERTLQPDKHRWIVKMLDGEMRDVPHPGSEESTVVPTATQKASSPQSSIATSTAVSPTEDDEYDGSDYESDSEAGTLWQPWQPTKKRQSRRVSKPPSLHPIQTSSPVMPPVPPIPPPQPPYRKISAKGLSPGGNVNRHSSFTKRDSITWAFRPPPEDMYERLEEFFPDHDLDKPVIDATPSGGSSPTQAEHPPPPAFPPPNRTRHKKSIRVVAHERASKIGSTAQNMLRKNRSTKLWGSRVEEVTPAQAKGGALSAAPDSPSGVPTPKRECFRSWLVSSADSLQPFLNG